MQRARVYVWPLKTITLRAVVSPVQYVTERREFIEFQIFVVNQCKRIDKSVLTGCETRIFIEFPPEIPVRPRKNKTTSWAAFPSRVFQFERRVGKVTIVVCTRDYKRLLSVVQGTRYDFQQIRWVSRIIFPFFFTRPTGVNARQFYSRRAPWIVLDGKKKNNKCRSCNVIMIYFFSLVQF